MPKILVIDDDHFVRRQIEQGLVRRGYLVSSTADPRTGIHLARELKPHLILLDVLLPHTDGISTLHQIRKIDELRHVPVIMITVMRSATCLEECREAGAVAHLTKPFSTEELHELVATTLEASETDAPASDWQLKTPALAATPL